MILTRWDEKENGADRMKNPELTDKIQLRISVMIG